MRFRSRFINRWKRRGSASSYSTFSILIHWITAAALALAVPLGWRMTVTGGAERESTLALHVSIGIAVLLLSVLRIGSWLVQRPPSPISDVSWERRAARIVHLGFYALLIAIPLFGWLNISSSSGDNPNHIFGFVPLPNLPGVSGSGAVGTFAETSHRLLAYGLCFLLFFHIAGALKHHLKDPSSGLMRVLPGARNIFGWRAVGIACLLAVLFVLGGGFVDSMLPRVARLVDDAPAAGDKALIDPRKAPVFASVMQPIFDQKCVNCHGSRAQKGGLRLDSFAALVKGGGSGSPVVSKRAGESELIRRIMLPASDKEAMPPAGRSPLTAAEGQLAVWWVDAGADETSTITAASPPALVQNILEGLGVSSQSPVFALPVERPDPSVLEALRTAGYQVQFVFSGAGFIKAQPRYDRNPHQPLKVEALTQIADQLVWLDLSGAQVPEDQFAALARLGKLQRLNLAQTQADDGVLEHLRDLQYLEVLNLYGTAVTDKGLMSVAGIQSLTSVYVSDTAVTGVGIGQVCKEHRSISVVWQPRDAQGSATAAACAQQAMDPKKPG